MSCGKKNNDMMYETIITFFFLSMQVLDSLLMIIKKNYSVTYRIIMILF